MPHYQHKTLNAWPFVLVLLSARLALCYPNINPENAQHQQNYLTTLNRGFFQAPPQVEETIDEVQRILANDPTLPRLTRGEIEELYEKVTREEYEKSVEAGDMGRADSMRALMLVLPYNIDNNTEENLQELYTRPPVTKVVDSYTSHPPIKFVTADPNAIPRVTENNSNKQISATTYKPSYNLPANIAPSPTTYHPPPPAIMQQMVTTNARPIPSFNYQAATALPYAFDNNGNPKLTQRFSSHYNAKNADFLRKSKRTTTTSTTKPVADVLESLGIIGQTQSRHRFAQPDYFVAESAPQPVISSYVPSVADLQNYRGVQSLSAKIRPDAYTNFKPLNIGEELRIKPEVESYLTRFGIVGGRKRKELDKAIGYKSNDEQASAESEIATAKVPNTGPKAPKTASSSNAELMKLLENLQELERLNNNVKVRSTTARPATTTTTSTTTTTTTTTTKAPTTITDLLTHGTPMLIEPKKPRRRIDPNIDLAFANAGNQQPMQSSTQQLAKLLANLQELEKLQINPENVLKQAAPKLVARPSMDVSVTAAPPPLPRSSILTNRFSEFTQQTPRPQTDAQQLEQVLKQLQLLEQQNIRASTTTTTTTTTARPQIAKSTAGLPVNDLLQLRMLLSNERELQRLYEQARAGQKITLTTSRPPTTRPPTTTTTTTTSTTTPKPATTFDYNNLEQLQKYFAAMEQQRASITTPTTTTTSTSTTTTTTPLPPPPPPPPPSTAKTVKKSNVNPEQLQDLINRVHELERFNSQKESNYEVKPTDASFPLMGFTTRNVKADYVPPELPNNDFAHLQKLFKQVQEAEEASYGQVEISTAATASKYQPSQGKRTQNFAQRIIDITNDTGSGSSLQAVDPDDFVQLQKLLRKVQELERVKIKTSTDVGTQRRSTLSGTAATQLVTSASIRSQNVQRPNNAHIVYAEKPKTYDNIAEILKESDSLEELKLDLPAYEVTTPQPKYVHQQQSSAQDMSSEELHQLAYSRPANPMQAQMNKQPPSQYQQFLSKLEDNERDSYQKMQPPIIEKTINKEPPRFIATRKPEDVQKQKMSMPDKQTELKELQKLLNNAQELEKLGVTLPQELSEQIESKLMTATSHMNNNNKKANAYVEQEKVKPTTTSPYLYDSEEPSERTAVFSLTTQKSATPRPPTTSTESTIELPVFSATKIIEAAIKRAANRIGVSTEANQVAKGFRRRDVSGEDDDLVADDDELMGQFSELNYQLAALPEGTRTQRSNQPELNPNDKELQRLIANLQELQKLNINLTPQQAQEADSKYLETLKQQLSETEQTKKDRRQSATTTTTTTTSAPTRLQLDLSLDDSKSDGTAAEANATEDSSTSSTTEESRNGSLADLEESFGPNPVPDTTTPPPKKKNGFYFLADWNSFLEVGDGDDQVVVRFSPKIGDPRLFLPVKIP